MTQNDDVLNGAEAPQPDAGTTTAETEQVADTTGAEPDATVAGEGAAVAQNEDSPSEAADADTASEIEQLQAALQAAEAKAADNWDRVVRMQAEMENTRKRLRQEADNARKFGQTSLIEELLPICDSMEMGLQAANEDGVEIGKIREGYALTAKMLTQMLGKFNVEVIDPVDEKFDPEKHQAMSMQEGTGKEANTVVHVMQKGYTLNSRLIRPALVMVAK
jgi:molecular chaperone GrpE